MLDSLPREIVDIILEHVEPHYNRALRPPYTFIHKSRALVPLTQVSRGWRSTISSMTAEYTSIAREYETQSIDTTASGLAKLKSQMDTRIQMLAHSYPLVRELEVHASIEFTRVQVFTNVKALTILGDTSIQEHSGSQTEMIPLDHLEFIALAISTSKSFTLPYPQRLKRLDVLLDSDLSWESLAGFQSINLEELNISCKGLSSPLTMEPLVRFIAGLPRLKKLSLRRHLSKFPGPTLSKQSSIKDFLDTIRSLPLLDEIFIEMSYLRADTVTAFLSTLSDTPAGFVDVYESSNQSSSPRTPLTVSIVEPSLAGQWSFEEETSIIKYLTYLSQSFEVIALKFIYGVQTELPPQVTTLSFVHLLNRILSEQHTSLYSLNNFYSMMAWNVLDGVQSFVRSQQNPYSLMSYETDSTFSPNYRKCIKFKRLTSHSVSGVIITRDGEEEEAIDNNFWSRDTILNHLFKYSEKRRKSSIWD